MRVGVGGGGGGGERDESSLSLSLPSVGLYSWRERAGRETLTGYGAIDLKGLEVKPGAGVEERGVRRRSSWVLVGRDTEARRD